VYSKKEKSIATQLVYKTITKLERLAIKFEFKAVIFKRLKTNKMIIAVITKRPTLNTLGMWNIS